MRDAIGAQSRVAGSKRQVSALRDAAEENGSSAPSLIADRTVPSASMIKVNGDITQFLTSPRDNQPYMIIWGVNARTGIPDPVAYEQTGASGTRMIGLGAGYVIYADEEKFKEMIPNAK